MGVGKKGKVFLFTDSHVIEEGFLEFINNILTTGMIPGLFEEGDKDELVSEIRDESRKENIAITEEWNFYVGRAKDNIHMSMCFSPAGDALRVRCRNFPGVISQATIDWFFPWPENALEAVSK